MGGRHGDGSAVCRETKDISIDKGRQADTDMGRHGDGSAVCRR